MSLLNITWSYRYPALTPTALLCWSEHKPQLLKRLLQLPSDHLARLKGIYNQQLLVILGSSDDLPWRPGFSYFGQEDSAPGLFTPTMLKPNVSLDLVQKKLYQQYGTHHYLLAPEGKLIIPLQQARQLHSEFLSRLIE